MSVTNIIKPQRCFAGIGSPHTPKYLFDEIASACRQRFDKGMVLRTGASRVAEEKFEECYLALGGKVEVYLPWANYHDHPSSHYKVGRKALAIIEEVRSGRAEQSARIRRLAGRYAYIILGPDLKSPVSEVVCATPHGNITGSHSVALLLARAYDIPVTNLYTDALMSAQQKTG